MQSYSHLLRGTVGNDLNMISYQNLLEQKFTLHSSPLCVEFIIIGHVPPALFDHYSNPLFSITSPLYLLDMKSFNHIDYVYMEKVAVDTS